MGCASPENLGQETVPGSALYIPLLDQQRYHVSGSEAECFNEHLRIVEVARIADLRLLLWILLQSTNPNISCVAGATDLFFAYKV